MNISTNQLIAFLSVCLPILVPMGQALLQRLLDGLPSAKRAHLELIVSTVVHGVEQSMTGNGAVKKAAAVQAVMQIAKAARIPSSIANPTNVSMLIEAAVYELNQFSGAGSSVAVPSYSGIASAAPLPAV